MYLKDDGVNPTASLKDRASVWLSPRHLNWVMTRFHVHLRAMRPPPVRERREVGLNTVIFVPERAPQGKLAQMLIFGRRWCRSSAITARPNLSKAAIAKYGWYNRNAGINPVMAEGKRPSREIAEQLNFEPTDWVAVSVGDGCTIGACILVSATCLNWA